MPYSIVSLGRLGRAGRGGPQMEGLGGFGHGANAMPPANRSTAVTLRVFGANLIGVNRTQFDVQEPAEGSRIYGGVVRTGSACAERPLRLCIENSQEDTAQGCVERVDLSATHAGQHVTQCGTTLQHGVAIRRDLVADASSVVGVRSLVDKPLADKSLQCLRYRAARGAKVFRYDRWLSREPVCTRQVCQRGGLRGIELTGPVLRGQDSPQALHKAVKFGGFGGAARSLTAHVQQIAPRCRN